ncbi:hypothetical protein F5Y03DRAFT_379317 [Xylaria venustula]|nr:hypothetical protein F5Y03DRAFT_379317 [Xylaria venustula]
MDALAAYLSGWQNIFPACQLSFGEVSTLGKPHDDSYDISVQEDGAGWSGTSPLIASLRRPSRCFSSLEMS